MELIVRADGNKNIGFGHLIRCLALCQVVNSRGVNVKLFAKSIETSMYDAYINNNISVIKIENEEDFFKNLTSDSLVLLDGYHFNINYEKRIKLKSKLIKIEDRVNIETVADLLVNYGPDANESDYIVKDYTKFALGLEYVVLRSEFLDYTPSKVLENKSVFINFGGSDPQNITIACILAVLENYKDIQQINVVIGGSYAFEKELVELQKKYNSIIFIYKNQSAAQMKSLMEQSSFAIAPTSTICLELMALRKKIIASYYMENQRGIFNGLSRLKAIIPINDFSSSEITLGLNKLDTFTPRKLIDGNSMERLVNKILEI